MQLNQNTIKVLSNFATIQDNLVVKAGKNIMTMAEARNIIASATLDQEFPEDFGVYNLSEFLSAVSLLNEPSIKFNEEYMQLTDSVGKTKIKYLYADASILTTPPNEPKITEADFDVHFTLDETTLTQLRRAAQTLEFDFLIIEPSDDNVKLSLYDPKNPTSNSYSVEIPGDVGSDPFKFIIEVPHLKMMPSSYDVAISRKLLSRFVTVNGDLTLKYYIALNKQSTYGEK